MKVEFLGHWRLERKSRKCDTAKSLSLCSRTENSFFGNYSGESSFPRIEYHPHWTIVDKIRTQYGTYKINKLLPTKISILLLYLP